MVLQFLQYLFANNVFFSDLGLTNTGNFPLFLCRLSVVMLTHLPYRMRENSSHGELTLMGNLEQETKPI